MNSEKIVSRWYNEIGKKCLNFYKKSQNNELKQLPKLLKKIPKKSQILDAGCGNGKPVAKFLSEKGYRVTGIDISRVLIKEAKKNAPKAKFKIMSLYNLTFTPKKFDAIVSFFAILHLEKGKVEKVFKNFNNSLKKEGILLFSVNEGKKEGYFEFFKKEVFYSTYTQKEIEDILHKTNFEIIWKENFLFNKNKSKESQLYYLARKIK